MKIKITENQSINTMWLGSFLIQYLIIKIKTTNNESI